MIYLIHPMMEHERWWYCLNIDNCIYVEMHSNLNNEEGWCLWKSIYILFTRSPFSLSSPENDLLKESFFNMRKTFISTLIFPQKHFQKQHKKYEKEKSNGWIIFKRLPTKMIDVTKIPRKNLMFDNKIWVTEKGL